MARSIAATSAGAARSAASAATRVSTTIRASVRSPMVARWRRSMVASESVTGCVLGEATNAPPRAPTLMAISP